MYSAYHKRAEDRQQSSSASAAPAIHDYGIIGDCRTAALVSREGSIDWLCLPDFSSPSVFSRLLDSGRGGSFSIAPPEPFTTERQYVGQTAVLETTFYTAGGRARVIDFFPVLDGINPIQPMREILRIVEGCAGTTELQIQIQPRPDYGRLQASLQQRGRLGWAYTWHDEILLVRSDVDLLDQGGGLEATLMVGVGERRYFSLAYTKSDPAVIPLLGVQADERLTQTVAWWEAW